MQSELPVDEPSLYFFVDVGIYIYTSVRDSSS